MGRKIELVFDETDTRAIAEMHDDLAPKTCASIWTALETPMRVKGIHAMFAGREIMLEMPKENQRFDPTAIPPENQTITPLPGELMWFHFPAHAEMGFPQEIFDFAIIYGRDTRMLIPQGWVPGNVFATITQGLPEFAKCCERVRTEGLKWFTVRRHGEA
ncbi:MAG: DUF3830 family protein [Alphaproteobacteria bacterium]